MTSMARRPRSLTSQLKLLACVVVVVSVAAGGAQLMANKRAKANVVYGPVQVGTSFSPRKAAYLGLDWQAAYTELLGMHFKVIRLPAYWNEVDDTGYAQLDWMMAESAKAGQPVVLTVGMKSLGWPEFYVPDALQPAAGAADGSDITIDPDLRSAALVFVEDVVARYRSNPQLVAWQVENEPFNRAGPQKWWLGQEFVSQEIKAVKALDPKPVIVTVFSHFNRGLDAASSRQGFDLRQMLGFEVDTAETDSLSVLGPGDILGMDVYTRIGYRFLGRDTVSTANDDWDQHVARWRLNAQRQGVRAWATEAQAEPWEADKVSYTAPKSFGPQNIKPTFTGLKEAGYSTVLLWGAEYWLWQDHVNGDPRWLQAVRDILIQESRAPAVS